MFGNSLSRLTLAVVLLVLLVGTSFAGHALLEPAGSLALKAEEQSPASRIVVKFDLSSIPKDSRIDLAELIVTVNSDTALGKRAGVQVFAAESNWATAAVASTAEVATTDSLMMSSFVRTGEEQHLEINVTELVKLWREGKVENHGFVLMVRNNSDRLFAAKQTGAGIEAHLRVFFSGSK